MTRYQHTLEDREDGLGHCLTCGGAEASMPTLCPGRRLTEREATDVQACRLDFNRLAGSPFPRWLIAQPEPVPDELYGIQSFTPAEMRAYDYAFAGFIKAVQKILDGDDDGLGKNYEPWGKIRRQLIALRNNVVEIGARYFRLHLAAKNYRISPTATNALLLDEALVPRLPYPRMSEGATIRYIVVNPDEKDVGFGMTGSRSTADATRDLMVMEAALEFCYAKKRGVDISDAQFVEHLMRRFQ